ncbi:hypothetical protein GCM10009536_13280 [Streptomyces thermocarboxydus]
MSGEPAYMALLIQDFGKCGERLRSKDQFLKRNPGFTQCNQRGILVTQGNRGHVIDGHGASPAASSGRSLQAARETWGMTVAVLESGTNGLRQRVVLIHPQSLSLVAGSHFDPPQGLAEMSLETPSHRYHT